MKILCILTFLFWTSFKQAGSELCTASAATTQDVYMCTDSKVVNITEVKLRSSTNASSPTCSCTIQHHSGLDYAVTFNREPNYENYYDCGTTIEFSNTIFKCQKGAALFNSSEASTRIQFSGGAENVSWCMTFTAATAFSIECFEIKTTPVTSMSTTLFASLLTSSITSEQTSQYSVTASESFTSSRLVTSQSPNGTSTVTTLRPVTDYTTNSQMPRDIMNTSTTSVNINEHTTVTQTGKGLQDTHIVIIAVSTTCFVLFAITVFAVCCHFCRKGKRAHQNENNALDDTTNLHSTHDYRNITNQKSCDLEVINQMYIPADSMDFDPTNPNETSTDDRYADVSEITVKRNPETDKHVVNSMSNESGRGINGNSQIHESEILKTDVDPQYSVVQKNRDTESKAKKVSFSENNQDLPAIPVESNGTDNIYAQVYKKSEIRM